MSADLHVILFEPINISIEAVNEYASFELTDEMAPNELTMRIERHGELVNEIYGNEENDFTVAFGEDCWIGQVSWMKSLQDEQAKKEYIPAVIQYFETMYLENGGTIQLTAENITKLLIGFDLPSASIYERTSMGETKYDPTIGWFGITQKEKVKEFMEAHSGEWSFLDSW